MGKFIQPDSVIPDLTNPQAFNRYSYAYNNPIRYSDPTGHWPDWIDIGEIAENIVTSAVEVVAGAVYQVVRSTREAIPPSLNASQERMLESYNSPTTAFQVGRMIGAAVTIVGGAVATVGGAGVALAGTVECGTGVLCLAGAVQVAGGAVVATAGAYITVQAAIDLAEIGMAFADGGQGSGADSLEEDLTENVDMPDYDSPIDAETYKYSDPPGPEWEWRGPEESGSWFKPSTKEYLRSDFTEVHGPHYDWRDPAGNGWRIYFDNMLELKK